MQVGFSFASLLLLAGVLMLIGALFAQLRRGAPLGRVLGYALLILLVIGGGLTVFLPVVHRVKREAISQIGDPAHRPPQVSRTALPAVWQDDIELELAPDTYSSRDIAARALARRAAQTIDPATISYIRLAGRPADLAGVDVARAELERLLPGVPIRVVSADEVFPDTAGNPGQGLSINIGDGGGGVNLRLGGGNDPSAGRGEPLALTFNLNLTGHSTTTHDGLELHTERGQLQLQVSQGAQHRSYTADYEEKDWLAHYPELRNRVRQLHVARGLSQAAQPTPVAAEAEALQDLREQLSTLAGTPYPLQLDTAALNSLLADVFIQELPTSGAPTYRAAVVAAVHPHHFSHWQNQARAGVRLQRGHLLSRGLTLLVLLAVLVGVYVMLNLATRGYYTWTLRLATLALMFMGGYLALQWF